MMTRKRKIQFARLAFIFLGLTLLAQRPVRGETFAFYCEHKDDATALRSALVLSGGRVTPEIAREIAIHCEPSQSDTNGSGYSISLALNNPSVTPSGNQKTAQAAAAASPSLNTLFQWTEPLLLAPQFPASAIDSLSSACLDSWQAYQVDHTGNLLTVFGLCPLRLIKRISIPSSPLQVAITPDASQALVTGYDGTLTFVNTASNNVTFTMDLGNYNPHGIAISPDGARAYVTHYLDITPSLLVIDIPNRKLLSTIPMPFVFPRTITLTPDGSQAWVNYFGGGVVTVVDLMTGTVAGSVNIGQLVSTGIAFNTTGTKAYVAVEPDQLYVVDTALLTVKKRITVGNGPLDIVVAPTGDRVYVGTEFDPALWAIDPVSDTLQFRAVDPTRTTGGNRGLLIFP